MSKEKKIELATVLGTTVFRQVASVWFVKAYLTRLTGRKFGWKDGYAFVAVAQIAGGYMETGRRLEVDAHKAVEEFKSNLKDK